MMDQQGGVYIFIGFIVTIVVIGLGYTLIFGVLGALPTGPDTDTMDFLIYVLAYCAPVGLLIAVLWFLNSMQKERYGEY
jgi:hypothetical protein